MKVCCIRKGCRGGAVTTNGQDLAALNCNRMNSMFFVLFSDLANLFVLLDSLDPSMGCQGTNPGCRFLSTGVVQELKC